MALVFSIALSSCTPLGNYYVSNGGFTGKKIGLIFSDHWMIDSIQFKSGDFVKLRYNSHQEFDQAILLEVLDSKIVTVNIEPNTHLFLGSKRAVESVFDGIIFYNKDEIDTVGIDSVVVSGYFKILRRFPNKYLAIYNIR